MRFIRFGGVALVTLLAGCQAMGASPTPSPSPRPTASAHHPHVSDSSFHRDSQSPGTPSPSKSYDPLYCGVQQAAAGKPANVLLTIDDFPYGDGEEMVRVAAWAKQTNTMMEAFPISEPVAAHDKAHHTDLVARTRALGTYVGNHTFDHPNLRNVSLSVAEREIIRGVKSTYVRPPYGAYTRAIRAFVEEDQHARICYWTIDTGDWQRPKNGAYPPVSTLLSRVRAQLKDAKPGVPVVVLGHYYTNYPEALPGIRSLVVQAGLHICQAPPGPTTASVPYPIC